RKTLRALTQWALRRIERLEAAHGAFRGGNEPGRGLRGPRRKEKKKGPCGKKNTTNLFGAPSPGNTPSPVDIGSSRLYNPNLQNNIGAGAFVTGTVGAGVTVFVLVNVVGFPEAELSE